MANLSSWLEDVVGAAPTDLKLFEQALTHGSTGEAHYQRLEFLGDRVLGLVAASMLFQRFPMNPKGACRTG